MFRTFFTQRQIRNWNSGTPWLHSPGRAAFTMAGREAADSQAGSVRSDVGACTHACPDAAVLLLNRTRCLCMPAHIRLKLPESRLYFDMLCHLDCMRAHVCACVFCSVWKARPPIREHCPSHGSDRPLRSRHRQLRKFDALTTGRSRGCGIAAPWVAQC